MKISEAAQEASRTGGYMVRESVYSKYGSMLGLIWPTNSYECCMIATMTGEKHIELQARCWNPTLDDLIASDWTVIKI